MQWTSCNQPFGQVAFESIPNNIYYQTIPSCRAIGEGEVTSICIPGGSTQMCFIPTTRYDRWPPFQYDVNFPNVDNNKNVNTEYWFVRSISVPIPSTINKQAPNLCGNSMLTQLFTPNYSTNIPLSRPEYYQKFHNDSSTSTTDIVYFYPSLRAQRTYHSHAVVQTSKLYENHNDEVKCPCKVRFKVVEDVASGCFGRQSTSSMSVDSVKRESSPHSILSKKTHRRSKRKNKRSRSKRRHHDCKCNDSVKTTSDKLVTTYMDTASGGVQGACIEGRDTQTNQKPKRDDIKTEMWIPINNTKSNSSANTANQSDTQTSLSDCCAGTSATETDTQ